MQKSLKKVIGNNSHWTINKTLARTIGLNTTLVLQHLIDLSAVFKKNEIFQPYEEMSDELSLSVHAIKTSIAELKKLGVIEVERKSVGYKNFYKVNEKEVLKLINGAQLTSEVNSTHQLGEVENNFGSVENLLTSEVDTTLSELNIISHSVENLPAITNNTTNNTLEKNINKNTTTSSSGSIENITEKILDKLINPELTLKEYSDVLEDFIEVGGIDGVSEIMKWDTSMKNNWIKKIKNVSLFY